MKTSCSPRLESLRAPDAPPGAAVPASGGGLRPGGPCGYRRWSGRRRRREIVTLAVRADNDCILPGPPEGGLPGVPVHVWRGLHALVAARAVLYAADARRIPTVQLRLA